MTTTNAAIVPTVAPGNRLTPADVLNAGQNLSLMNGMTAGYGVNDGNNSNPPPAPGQLGKWDQNWPWQPTRVGFLQNVVSLGGAPSNPSGIYTLYFMYNPNEIDVSWSTNPGQVAPLYAYGQDVSSAFATASNPSPSNAAVPALANTQSVHWALYFDRTYDMMYGNPGSAADDRGVLKDVAALYNLLGTFISDAAVPISSPCQVVFGQNGAGQLWGFTGYINSLSITYGIFRHDMIPSRCEVDVTMTATYVANNIPATAGPNASTPGNGLTTTLITNTDPTAPKGPPANAS